MTTVRTSTFDLKLLKSEPNKHIFPWGDLKVIHEIGRYAVLEVCSPNGVLTFHSYVDNEALEGLHTMSLEEALLMCLAHRRVDNEVRARVIAAAILLKLPEFDK